MFGFAQRTGSRTLLSAWLPDAGRGGVGEGVTLRCVSSVNFCMNPEKRQRLEAAGWSIGDASDFLGLSPEEAAFIELKLALSKAIKQQRESQKLTQQALAKRIKSSQSRVAKMEAGDPSVSLDFLIRTLLSAGATAQDIAEAIQNTTVQSVMQ